MMQQSIRQLCAVSLLCGAALSMLPESGVKRVAEIVCTASIILAVISPLKTLDMADYALESAKLHEMETALSRDAEEVGERLNRLVIEGEYETYIMDKARELGMEGLKAEVEVQWSLEGLWMPWSAGISGQWAAGDKARLSALIQADLGIPLERQRWQGE